MPSRSPDPDSPSFKWDRVIEAAFALIGVVLVADFVLRELQWPWFVAALVAPIGGAVGWFVARLRPMM
jgi:hypothetical protein